MRMPEEAAATEKGEKWRESTERPLNLLLLSEIFHSESGFSGSCCGPGVGHSCSLFQKRRLSRYTAQDSEHRRGERTGDSAS